MAHLLGIPLEILEQILLFCHPRDVARFSGTCRVGEDLVYRSADLYFWRQLFLLIFDDPRHALKSIPTDPTSFDWRGQLIRRMKAERAVFTDTPDRESALETLVSIAEEAPPNTGDHTDESPASRNIRWLDNVLRTSHILDNSFSPNEAKFGDRLKAYMGLSLKEETDENMEELRALRTGARCFVYNLRNYHRGNRWGPYLLDGSVNWSHIEKIINVVETNLREQHSALIPRPPAGLQATRAHSAPGDFTGPDWAGVEGNHYGAEHTS